MASFIGVTYFEIVKHAFLPAIISYIALFYISHLEALKLNLKGMDDADVPHLKKLFIWDTFFNTNFCFNLYFGLFKIYCLIFNFLCNHYFGFSKFNKFVN